MNPRVLTVYTIALCGAGACASPGVPPGGPIDTDAPKLLAVAPESGRVNITPPAAIFRFDEIVNERPLGAPTLGDLFVVSPQDGVPEVDWGKREIAVKPRGGWRPNTTYTVQLLPGISDLQGNVSLTGAVTVFSTGSTIPATRLTGAAFDWVAGARAPGARVEAITPDSVIYATSSDSTGEFTFAHLPPGRFTVRAILDENRNRALDPQEKWDSAGITLVDTARAVLFAYKRDSVPPRISEVIVVDSLALRLQFDLPLDAEQTLDAGSFTVRAADSSAVPIRAVALAADSGSRIPRRVPPREIVLSMAQALAPNASYSVTARGVRGLIGIATNTERAFRVPSAAADSVARAIRRPSPIRRPSR